MFMYVRRRHKGGSLRMLPPFDDYATKLCIHCHTLDTAS